MDSPGPVTGNLNDTEEEPDYENSDVSGNGYDSNEGSESEPNF